MIKNQKSGKTIVFDDPFFDLDTDNQTKVWNILTKLAEENCIVAFTLDETYPNSISL